MTLGSAALLAGSDIDAIGAALRHFPSAVAISAVVHIPQIAMTAIAWRTVVPRKLRPFVVVMSQMRWYRESAGTLLPMGGLVGQVAAARLLARCGVPGCLAGATATVDLTLEAVSQVLVTLAGLALLAGMGRATGNEHVIVAGVGAAGGCAIGLVGLHWLVRQPRTMGWLERVAGRWPGLPLGGVMSICHAVLGIHAQTRSLVGALCWHSGAWVFGAVEIIGVLGLLGRHISFSDAFVVESIAQALRSAGFMLPGAVGVQEAALVGAAALVGISPGHALTVALVRRTREVVMSVVGLVAWNRSEATWPDLSVPPSDRARDRE